MAKAAEGLDIGNGEVFANNPQTEKRIGDIFSQKEIRELAERSDLMGFWAVFMTWGGVALIFSAMALSSHFSLWLMIPSLFLGTALLAGRQLSLSIIVHDAAHGTLFKTRWLNTHFVDWICARPLWNDLAKYRAYHYIHHVKTGTEDDPDLVLRVGYPTSSKSLFRKFSRDMSGVLGLKYLIGRVLMDAGILEWTVTGKTSRLPRNGRHWHHYLGRLIRESFPMIVANVLLWNILNFAGYAWLYVFWVLAHLTFFMLFMRIRSMAEHAMCENNKNMFENTRSIKAGWIARMFVAPIGVNFHMEHHIMASCPWFNLSKAHQMLQKQKAVPESPSYWQVIMMMASLGRAQKISQAGEV